MTDDVPSLRPSLLPPLGAVVASLGLVAVIGGAVLGALAIRDWHDQRRIEAVQRTSAHSRAVADQIIAHFSALRRANAAGAESTSCPPSVTGKIPVIEKPVLDWLVDDGDDAEQPRPALAVRSPVFHYLDGSRVPGFDDATGFRVDKRGNRRKDRHSFKCLYYQAPVERRL